MVINSSAPEFVFLNLKKGIFLEDHAHSSTCDVYIK